jgi:hypothetical protein
VKSNDGEGRGGGGLEIEAAAGILLASIFAFFILTYTLFLQCWWRCNKRQNKHNHDSTASTAAKMEDDCACFAQTVTSTWEQVDLEKCLSGGSVKTTTICDAASAGKTS